MAGEFKVANSVIEQTLNEAETDNGMSRDAMANALQSALITEMLKSRPAADVRQNIEFLLENADSEFMVVTRGC